jgi:hypothetical protein
VRAVNPIVHRVAGAVLVALLLVLWLRVEPVAVPAGGDAFASAAGGRSMAVAAAQNADALADLLVAPLFDEPAKGLREGQRQ